MFGSTNFRSTKSRYTVRILKNDFTSNRYPNVKNHFRDNCLTTRVARFFLVPKWPQNRPQRAKIYKSDHKNTPKWPQNVPKWPQNILNRHTIYQMTRKCTNMFHSKALQNAPILGFLVLKYTIWQSWFFSWGKVIRLGQSREEGLETREAIRANCQWTN
jgi:hypothetical protein